MTCRWMWTIWHGSTRTVAHQTHIKPKVLSICYLKKGISAIWEFQTLYKSLLLLSVRHSSALVLSVSNIHHFPGFLVSNAEEKAFFLVIFLFAFTRRRPTLRETLWDTEPAAETWAFPQGPGPSSRPWLQTCSPTTQRKAIKNSCTIGLNERKKKYSNIFQKIHYYLKVFRDQNLNSTLKLVYVYMYVNIQRCNT